MNEFIQKNRGLLRFYCIALRLSAWILLTLGISSYAITIILARILNPKTFAAITLNMPLRTLNLIFFGLLGLGVAQLIKYILDYNSKPGFILRHGDKFLYVYLFLTLVGMIIRILFTLQYLKSADIRNTQILFFSTSITSIVLFAAKALILIGLAQFLKRLIPITEEHKSLI